MRPLALALSLLALAWAVPNYPAAIPSWYNLFLATGGCLALIRWTESARTGWLVMAGALGGLSFLFKLSGLFFLAGAGLFLLEATRPEPPTSAEGRRAWWLPLMITIGLGLFVLVLWRSIAPVHHPSVVLHLFAPVGLLAFSLAMREWLPPPVEAGARLNALFKAVGPLVLGAAIPVGAALGVAAAAGALDEVGTGVFAKPFRRLTFATWPPPDVYWLVAVVPLVLLLRPRSDHEAPAWRRRGLLGALLLEAALFAAAVHHLPHQFAWQALRGLIPLLGLVVAVVLLAPSARLAWPRERRLPAVLFASVALTCSLVQFPFASPIYFLYVAPLVFLAVAALVRGAGRTPRPLEAGVVGFYLAFGLLEVIPGAPIGLGVRYEGVARTRRLELGRGGLRLLAHDAAVYETVIPLIQRRAAGRPIWAGPDAPEVYFLSASPNPSRTLFEFLESDGVDGSALLEQLDRRGIRVVAINRAPPFSPAPDPILLRALALRFPGGPDTVGRFTVRWR